MLTILVTVVCGYLLIVGGLFFFQRHLVFFPDTTVPDVSTSGISGLQEVTYPSADGIQLRSWYFKAKPKMPYVLYFHGNAGNIGSRSDRIRPFISAGYGVLLAAYRGYGGNPGNPSEVGLLADARGAVEFLKDQGVEAKSLVLYGESLGTAVATQTAAEMARAGEPVGALVLEAPFISIVAVASSLYPVFPVRWLLKDRFDSGAVIGNVETPVFVFHGENDTIMPIRFGRALFAEAINPKESLWIEAAGHDDLFVHGADLAVLDFLKRHDLGL